MQGQSHLQMLQLQPIRCARGGQQQLVGAFTALKQITGDLQFTVAKRLLQRAAELFEMGLGNIAHRNDGNRSGRARAVL